MRKIFLLLSLSFVFAAPVFSQAAKSIHFEVGGPGLASFNFDTRFGPKEDGFGGRIGVGGFAFSDASAIFLPVGLNYLLGKDSKNYFEVGGGVTPVFISGDLIDDDDGTFSSTFGHITFGYRLQPLNGGFTFRAFISPVFGSGFFLPYYGGVSFGYKFGSSKKRNNLAD